MSWSTSWLCSNGKVPGFEILDDFVLRVDGEDFAKDSHGTSWVVHRCIGWKMWEACPFFSIELIVNPTDEANAVDSLPLHRHVDEIRCIQPRFEDFVYPILYGFSKSGFLATIA